MRIVIIEDELLAASKLSGYIRKQWPDAQIIATLASIDEVVHFFGKAQTLDLLFSDIELNDGQVFTALEQIDLPCPVIFTTSYNDFWMDAFQHQGIEYLLKPFSFKRFSQAVANYHALFNHPKNLPQIHFKQRFIIKQNGINEMLNVVDISCFRAANGTILAGDHQNQYHILSETNLSQIETQIDPKLFFRINRSDIININSLVKFETYNKETLALYLKGYSEIFITSKNRTANFRKWLEI